MSDVAAIDLFAGAGGATQGLRDAGYTVVAAIESDHDAAATYRANHPDVHLEDIDIRDVDPEDLRRTLKLRRGSLALLKACPPCQGFSSLARGEPDQDRNDLVLTLEAWVRAFRPRGVLLENVPGLARDYRLAQLLKTLEGEGYSFRQYTVNATQFGVPQSRKRLIVVGLSKSVRRSLPLDILASLPARFDRNPQTVREAFQPLRFAPKDDALNKHRRSSQRVLTRIKAIPVNGNRFDLPPELELDCHARLALTPGGSRNASASYGRLRWSEPSATMTTRCATPACGKFIHPSEHRGITLREAALLQTFPVTYDFVGNFGSVERQIGNAVPVRMAEALGLVVGRLTRRLPDLK